MDFTSLLGGAGGGGGGGQPKSSATASSVIGGRQETEQLQTLMPWIIGGIALVFVSIAAVAIAAIRR